MKKTSSKGTLFGKPIGQVVKRPGAFTAKANAAGMPVQKFAAKVTSPTSKASTTTKKQAVLAKTFAKMRKGK